jgi:hypothetical protein
MLLKKTAGRDNLGSPGVDGRIILEWISLSQCDGRLQDRMFEKRVLRYIF